MQFKDVNYLNTHEPIDIDHADEIRLIVLININKDTKHFDLLTRKSEIYNLKCILSSRFAYTTKLRPLCVIKHDFSTRSN